MNLEGLAGPEGPEMAEQPEVPGASEMPAPTQPQTQLPTPASTPKASAEAGIGAKLYIGLAVVLAAIIVVGAPMLLGGQPAPTTIITSQDRAGKPVEIEAAPPTDTAGSALKIGQSVIDLLEAQLHSEPENHDLVQELAVAYNNQALKQEDNPELALDSLWRSYALDPDGSSGETVANIDRMLLKLGKDPTDFAYRLKSADAQAAQACLYGAFSEYSLALKCPARGAGAAHSDDLEKSPKLTDDAATRAAIEEKIAKLKELAAKSSDDNINGAFYLKVGAK